MAIFYLYTMQFSAIQSHHLEALIGLLGADALLTDTEQLVLRSSDHTEDLVFIPELVVVPSEVDQIAKLLRYCNQEQIALTVRGAGTGLSGGALPIHQGIVLDMQRFNKILKIDTDNFQVTTEPGVITQVLQEAVLAHGLQYPPDPASKGSCFIGGNIAENSGGPRAVKYGVVKDYVLNLEIVLADGTVMWTGANVLKNATGYNLTQLIVGSEGTLAVVTKIVLKLIPATTANVLLLIPFRNAAEACSAVNTICLAGITPSALEFMERDALNWSMRFCNTTAISIPDDIQAHLLIELDGHNEEQLLAEAEQISELVTKYDIGELLFADTAAQKETLWQLRRKVGEAVKSNSVYKEEDTVVPRAHLPELLTYIKELGKEYGFQSVCYGHAGDGNLHVNIIKGTLSDTFWHQELHVPIRKLFEFVHALGGTISGEHGIGLVQKNYLDIVFSPAQIALMKAIKHVFDPKGILNPGKIFPDN